MTKKVSLYVLTALLFLTGVAVLWQAAVVNSIVRGDDGIDAHSKSFDLVGDVRLMWQTEIVGGASDRNRKSSTKLAINAASRVFNTVELIGKSRDEVIEMLGDPKTSSDSRYNFPFYPALSDALVYRFDTGAYGWQFIIEFNVAGRVREVKRLAIE